jgi:hypothetical protein
MSGGVRDPPMSNSPPELSSLSVAKVNSALTISFSTSTIRVSEEAGKWEWASTDLTYLCACMVASEGKYDGPG